MRRVGAVATDNGRSSPKGLCANKVTEDSEIRMRRIYACVISLVLLIATPGLAAADAYTRSVASQQAINYVIARGLSQRDVPYVYGGGDTAGPTLGVPRRVSASSDSTSAPTLPVSMLLASCCMHSPAPESHCRDPPDNSTKSAAKFYRRRRFQADLTSYGLDGGQSVAMFLGNGQMLEATDPAVVVLPVRTAGMARYVTRIIE